MNKYEIQVDNETFIVDDISYEYSQLDGQEAGRSDDGNMTRDVIGLTNKVYCKFNDKDRWYGRELSRLLKLTEITECSLNYFDAKEYARVTKKMYVVADKYESSLINNETYLKNEIEVRFTQMDVDAI